MLNRNFIFVFIFSFSGLIVMAQTDENNIAFGLNFVKNEYNGDYGNAIFDFKQPLFPAVGISLSKYITSSFDVGVQGSYGAYGYYQAGNNRFSGMKFDASLNTHYKFNNGYIFKEESKLTPFLSIGIGMASYGINTLIDNSGTDPSLDPTIITKGIDIIVPFGIGLKYQLTGSISIQYQYLYTLTNMDNHDENKGPNNFGPNNNIPNTPAKDGYGQHLLGLIFLFNEPVSSNDCHCNFN